MKCGAGTLLDREDVDGAPAISAFTSGDLVHDALRSLSDGEPGLFDGVLESGVGPCACVSS